MRRTDLALPWPEVRARMADISALIGGEDSRLGPRMQRVHQSRCARALAIDLLRELGVEAQAIGKGPAGEPVWPEGMTGSLAHTGQFAVAVVAAAQGCAGLGIDIEPALPLPEETESLILGDEEREWVKREAHAEPSVDRLVFCAKECVHKAVNPGSGAWLEFDEVRIRFDEPRSSFVPEPRSAAAEKALAGLQPRGHVMRTQGHYVVVLHLAPAV